MFEAVGAHGAGRIDEARLKAVEDHACPGAGACGGQFTANTMAMALEFLGISPAGANAVPAVFDATPATAPLDVDPDAVLTPKELEIFELLQGGLSNAGISEKAGTSITTTKWHLKNIYSKLGVSSRTEAVLRAASR